MAFATRAIERTTHKTNEPIAMHELPRGFIDWQIESRATLCRIMALGGDGSVRSMPSHLPVMASISEDGTVNMAAKGIGLVPKPALLERFTALFRRQANNDSQTNARSSIKERADALMTLYSDQLNIDPTRLGGLEIFEGSTFANLKRDPRASLLFVGEAPTFHSFQVDGTIEFVSEGDRYYEYLLSARQLFARESFHILQGSYPHGFVLHVENVRDKRPFSRM